MTKKGGKTGVICSGGVRGLCTSQVTPERGGQGGGAGRSCFTNHIDQEDEGSMAAISSLLCNKSENISS